jgi:4-amino-4-deoxy-L-arabinose transferase-like glycosyltransferase
MSQRPAAAWRSSLRRIARHPLAWILLAAVAVRVVVLAGVSVSLGYADTVRYVGQASGDDVEGDGIAPPGYALFLRIVHWVTESVDGVLVVQQALGIVAGVCVYVTARQMGTTRGVAAGAAGVMVLCGNLVSTGQAVLTESVFTTLIAVMAMLAVRQASAPSLRNALLLGAAIGGAIAVRTVALPVALALIVLIVLIADRSREGALRAGASVGAAIAVVAVVALAMSTTWGLPVVGKTAEGWVLYGRVAPFADCDEIDPPRRLRSLCVTDPGVRPGPDYYRFVGGPAIERFGWLPRGDSQLNDFATRTILAQPLDYAKAVSIDSIRFFAHNFGTERPYNGPGWDELELDRTLDPEAAATNKERIESWFSPYSPRDSTLRIAARYQEATTLQGGHLLVIVLLAAAGVIWGGGPRRRAAWLLLVGGLGLLVGAAAINQYVARYALPTFGFLLPAAAYGLMMLARRLVPSAAGGPVVSESEGDGRRHAAEGMRQFS